MISIPRTWEPEAPSIPPTITYCDWAFRPRSTAPSRSVGAIGSGLRATLPEWEIERRPKRSAKAESAILEAAGSPAGAANGMARYGLTPFESSSVSFAISRAISTPSFEMSPLLVLPLYFSAISVSLRADSGVMVVLGVWPREHPRESTVAMNQNEMIKRNQRGSRLNPVQA